MSNEMLPDIIKTPVVSDIYKDLAQPSVRRIGTSLETLTKVIASPISLIDWGYEKSLDWLKSKIDARLATIPSEYVVQPTANIVYEALSHIAVSHDTPELRDFYAELLLKSMDNRTADTVHPAYFHIIKQLAPQEALVLVGLHSRNEATLFFEKVAPYSSLDKTRQSIEDQFNSFCVAILSYNADQSGIWLTNLCRLGLLALASSNEAVFRPEGADRHGVNPAQVDNYEHRFLEFTEFGKAFIAACAPG